MIALHDPAPLRDVAAEAELAGDLALALDPVLLAARLGITPDPWQTAVLRSVAQQIIMLASRQSGKSTVSSIIAMHTAIYQPGALVLLLSPSLRQSQELFRKCMALYRLLDHVVPPDSETKLTLTLANGSRLISLPGKEATIRGFSGVDLLLVDEASRVSDELYQAVRPMLAVSGGRIVLLSTPFGKRGFFFHEWEDGGPDWHRVKITAQDCPRISPVWLAQERAQIGDWWFNQEYGCEFLDTVDQVFSSELVLAAITDEVRPLFAPSDVPAVTESARSVL